MQNTSATCFKPNLLNNSMIDSGECQEVESNHSGRLSHVPSQPAAIPKAYPAISRTGRSSQNCGFSCLPSSFTGTWSLNKIDRCTTRAPMEQMIFYVKWWKLLMRLDRPEHFDRAAHSLLLPKSRILFKIFCYWNQMFFLMSRDSVSHPCERSTLSRLAKEKGHQVRAMGV